MRRIIAWAGIIILLSLYIVTLVSAITSSKASSSLFWASAFSTVVVPLMIFILLRLHEYVVRQRDKFIEDAATEEKLKAPDDGRDNS